MNLKKYIAILLVFSLGISMSQQCFFAFEKAADSDAITLSQKAESGLNGKSIISIFEEDSEDREIDFSHLSNSLLTERFFFSFLSLTTLKEANLLKLKEFISTSTPLFLLFGNIRI